MSDKLNKCVFVLVIVFIIALILLTSISPSMNSSNKNNQIVYNLTEDKKNSKNIEHKTEADDSKRFPHYYFNFSTVVPINNNKSDNNNNNSEDNPIDNSGGIISIDTNNNNPYDIELKSIIENNSTIERPVEKPVIVGSNLVSDTVIRGKENYDETAGELKPVSYSEGTKLVADILRSGPWSDIEDHWNNLTNIKNSNRQKNFTSEPTEPLAINFDYLNVTKSQLNAIPFSFRALLNKKPLSLPLIEQKSNNKRNIVHSGDSHANEKISDTNPENTNPENGDRVKPEFTVARQSFKSQLSPLFYNKHYTTKHSYNKNFYTANKYSNPTAKYYKNFSERSDYFSDGDESFAPKPLLSVKEFEEYASVEKTPRTTNTQIPKSEDNEENFVRENNDRIQRPVEDLKRTYLSKVRRIQEQNSRLKNFIRNSPQSYQNSRPLSASNHGNDDRLRGNDANDGNEFRERIRENYRTTTQVYSNDDQVIRRDDAPLHSRRIPRPEYDDYNNANTEHSRPQVYRSVYTKPITDSLNYKPDTYRKTLSTRHNDDVPSQTPHYDDNDYESEKDDENSSLTEEPEEFNRANEFHRTTTASRVQIPDNEEDAKNTEQYSSKPKPYIRFTPYKPFEPFRPLTFPDRLKQRPQSNYRVIVERPPRNRVNTRVIHASPSNMPPEIKTLYNNHNNEAKSTTIRPQIQYTSSLPKIKQQISIESSKRSVIVNSRKNNSMVLMPTMTDTTVTANNNEQQMRQLFNQRLRQIFFPQTEVLSEYHTLIVPMRVTYPANITTQAERMAAERILARL